MSVDDKYACAELVQTWGLYRDQLDWSSLAGTFWPEGFIAVSWYSGPFSAFVEKLQSRGPGAGRAKHFQSPSVVSVVDDRAIAETCVAILVRQGIEGIDVDLTSNARFVDRLEQRGGAWKFIERTGVYEVDRIDPVEPSAAFERMMAAANSSRFPLQYRYMAFRVAAYGGAIANHVYCDGTPELEALRTRYGRWLSGH